MVRILAIAVAVATLLLAAWVFFLAWRNRPIGRRVLYGVAVAEALLLAQVVGAIVLVARGEHAAEPLTFTMYLIASTVALPAGTWWALGERSRSGTSVLGVAAVVAAVLVQRLHQTWS
ncbi:hypothetical protein [Pseudofrankia inefficax]|uniref:Integral membrane protein n=1 Tax=Pseudofrankia inefficax (strain DSM 45817 / CECT 9037 / DDB 130130 / EuI1c) TaxID=298654 RepID=E3J6H0_PSEI1|nr:hypothetical protein [Pseudofrankia inefficax]ADP80746.1 hypothetical protein FraEuI1c_2715 [Pseudofrankia inefficax]